MVLINFVKALIWALFVGIFAWVFGGEFYVQHFAVAAGMIFLSLVSGDLAELGLVKLFEEKEDQKTPKTF